MLAVSPGTAIITIATRDGDRKDHCTVTVEYPTVNVAVSSIALSVAQASIEVGGVPLILTHTITPSNATNSNVTWRSSAEHVATVNEDGIVSPISAGVTIITVETRDGNRTAHCTVTVTDGQTQKSAACDILSFLHITREWKITGNAITVIYPAGTILSSVAPTITVSQGATVFPPSLALQDFSDGKTIDRKSTRLNSSHQIISYAVFCCNGVGYGFSVREILQCKRGRKNGCALRNGDGRRNRGQNRSGGIDYSYCVACDFPFPCYV